MELGKDSPVGSREVCFFHCYLWGSNLKDTVMSWKRFGIENSFSMKELDGGPIIKGEWNTARQIRSKKLKKPRLKGFHLVSDNRGGWGYIVRRVWLETSGEILGDN